MSKKIKVALIGSGNIGTDLLIKALRSETIEPVWMVGIDEASDGLKKAQALGLKTTHQGIDGLLPHVKEDGIEIAFDRRGRPTMLVRRAQYVQVAPMNLNQTLSLAQTQHY